MVRLSQEWRHKVKTACSPYVAYGKERLLTNAEQLVLLRETVAHGAHWRFEALGHSMRQAIRDGDMVTVAHENGDPKPGDIWACRHPRNGRLVVHRIVARTDHGWLMRGDQCLTDDGEIPPDALLGRVIRIERRPVQRLRRKLAARLARLWRAAWHRES